MAYDEVLAGRIRDLIAGEPELTEKKMFGGLAFLIDGNMAVTASSHGGIMIRVDPAHSDELVVALKASVVEMRGRLMPGWLRVAPEHTRTSSQLAKAVQIAITYARSLPSKR